MRARRSTSSRLAPSHPTRLRVAALSAAWRRPAVCAETGRPRLLAPQAVTAFVLGPLVGAALAIIMAVSPS